MILVYLLGSRENRKIKTPESPWWIKDYGQTSEPTGHPHIYIYNGGVAYKYQDPLTESIEWATDMDVRKPSYLWLLANRKGAAVCLLDLHLFTLSRILPFDKLEIKDVTRLKCYVEEPGFTEYKLYRKKRERERKTKVVVEEMFHYQSDAWKNFSRVEENYAFR